MRINRFLEQSCLCRVSRLYRGVEQDVAAQLAPYSVNLIQGLVLAAIYFDDAATVRPSALSEAFGIGKPQVSQVISHLESMQYVRRVVDPKDARSYRLKVRAENRRKIQAIINHIERADKRAERAWKELG